MAPAPVAPLWPPCAPPVALAAGCRSSDRHASPQCPTLSTRGQTSTAQRGNAPHVKRSSQRLLSALIGLKIDSIFKLSQFLYQKASKTSKLIQLNHINGTIIELLSCGLLLEPLFQNFFVSFSPFKSVDFPPQTWFLAPVAPHNLLPFSFALD